MRNTALISPLVYLLFFHPKNASVTTPFSISQLKIASFLFLQYVPQLLNLNWSCLSVFEHQSLLILKHIHIFTIQVNECIFHIQKFHCNFYRVFQILNLADTLTTSICSLLFLLMNSSKCFREFKQYNSILVILLP